MDAILSDDDWQEAILCNQDAALDRLRRRDFAGTLLRFVETVRASPLSDGFPVTPDFWEQVADAERLEAIRLQRPAVFKGLPKDPACIPAELR
jgi:hypothetical protein